MNFDDLVARLTSNYDVSQAQAVAFGNERLARMVAESEFLMVTKSLGTTVAGQANYALATDLVDLSAVKIAHSDGTVSLYYGTSLDLLWRQDAGDGCTTGFALDFQADADVDLRLEPAPETAGETITGLYAQQPTVLAYGSTSVLPVPVDVHTHLLAGCQADCLDLEGRQDLSAKYEQRFLEGVGKLIRRKNSRGDSDAPHRIAVSGWDF